jgi:hypothetical protein
MCSKDCHSLHNGISQLPSQTSTFDNSCPAANCYQWSKRRALPLSVPAFLGRFDVNSTLAISVGRNTYEALKKPCVQYGTSSNALALEACLAASTYPTARTYSFSVTLTGLQLQPATTYYCKIVSTNSIVEHSSVPRWLVTSHHLQSALSLIYGAIVPTVSLFKWIRPSGISQISVTSFLRGQGQLERPSCRQRLFPFSY